MLFLVKRVALGAGRNAHATQRKARATLGNASATLYREVATLGSLYATLYRRVATLGSPYATQYREVATLGKAPATLGRRVATLGKAIPRCNPAPQRCYLQVLRCGKAPESPVVFHQRCRTAFLRCKEASARSGRAPGPVRKPWERRGLALHRRARNATQPGTQHTALAGGSRALRAALGRRPGFGAEGTGERRRPLDRPRHGVRQDPSPTLPCPASQERAPRSGNGKREGGTI